MSAHTLTVDGGFRLSTLKVDGYRSETLQGGLQGPPGPPVPAGVDTRVLFGDAGAVGSDARLTFDKTTGTFTLNGKAIVGTLIANSGTLAANAPALQASQTWNNAATAFTAALVNVIDTASDPSSRILDLQVGGVSRAYVDKSGGLNFAGYLYPITDGAIDVGSNAKRINRFNGVSLRLMSASNTAEVFASSNGIGLGSSTYLAWASGNDGTSNLDTNLYRDAAGVLALRNGTNQNEIRAYRTFTDPSNWVRGSLRFSSGELQLVHESLGATSAASIGIFPATQLNLGSGGVVTRWQINTAGHLLAWEDNQEDFGDTTHRPRNGYFAGNLDVNAAGNAAQGVASLTVWGSARDNNWGGAIALKSLNSSVSALIRASTAGLQFSYGGGNMVYDGLTFTVPGTSQAVARYNVTGLAADNRIWELGGVSGNNFVGRVWNDALNTAVNWLVVNRTGAAITGITLNPGSYPLEIASGASPQTVNVYGTKTDSSNYERFVQKYVSTGTTPGFTLTTESAGTGTARDLVLTAATGNVLVPGNLIAGKGSTNPIFKIQSLGSGTNYNQLTFASSLGDMASLTAYGTGYASTLAGVSLASALSVLAGAGPLFLYANSNDIHLTTNNTAPRLSILNSGAIETGRGGPIDHKFWDSYTSATVNSGLWIYNRSSQWFIGHTVNGGNPGQPLSLSATTLGFQTSGALRWTMNTSGTWVPTGQLDIGSTTSPMGRLFAVGVQTFYGGYTDASNNYGVSIGWLGGGLQFSAFFNGTGNGGSQPIVQINGQAVTLGIGTTGYATLDSAGNWRPYGVDAATDLGSVSNRWRTVFSRKNYIYGVLDGAIGFEMDDGGGASNSYLAWYRNGSDWYLCASKNSTGVSKNITFGMGDNPATGAMLRINATSRTIDHLAPSKLASYTVSTLPSAATVGDGARAIVTDATQTFAAANIGAAPTGGGTNKVPVIAFGGAWVIG